MKIVVALLALFVTAWPAAAQGTLQDWPTKPVKIVVPFGPGSTPDVVARLIADHLQKKLGQPFTIDNKPGASGNIGTDAVAKAAPDGTTIAVTPHAGSGAIKILAVSTAKRSPYLPDIPTLKEAGIDVDADAWMGMIAPAHTPEALVAKIQREVVEAIGTAAVREKLAAQLM